MLSMDEECNEDPTSEGSDIEDDIASVSDTATSQTTDLIGDFLPSDSEEDGKNETHASYSC